LNLKIPKDKDPHHVTYEEVLELATKAEKEPASAGKKRVINAKKVVKKK
jgi:topoisomerase IA-like protein